MAAPPTHAALCRHAVRWLRTMGCTVVASELSTAARETPDAIGWTFGVSLLVEVKTSLADFRRDTQKPWRLHPSAGVGDHRFYLTPAGLLRAADMPEGWGLLELRGRTVHAVHNAPHRRMDLGVAPFSGHKRNETMMLCSLIRRLEKPQTDRRKATSNRLPGRAS